MSEDKMTEIVSRIKTRRLELGMSYQDLANKTGMSKSTLQRYEAGAIQNIPLDKLDVLSDALQIDPVQLIGLMRRQSIHEAAAGEGRLNDGYPTEEYRLALEDDEIIVRVIGRSMEPTLQDGDVVVITAQNLIDYPRQIALVKVNGEEAAIKRVEIKSDGVMLIADNVDVYPPHFFTADEVEQLPVSIEGVVTRLIRDIK